MKTITMYELLGLVKDGKAPKKIKIDGDILNLEKGIETLYKFEKGGGSLAFSYYINNNKLNDEVEIIEEKKIPEKLDNEYFERAGSTYKDRLCKDKINEIIDYLDYLKSKGDE